MSLLAPTIKLDIQLQSKNKLYAIGIFVALLFGLVGRFFADADYAGQVLSTFFLTGLGGTTYMMSASLVLLEKSQGTIHALRTTPLTSTVYIVSKVITLTSFAVVESAIVYFVSFAGVPLNPFPLILGVVLLGIFYTLVGLGQVASHNSVTAFLLPGAVLVSAILQLPVFYVIAGPQLIWYLIPTHGSLLLMLGATTSLTAWQWAYALLVSFASIGILFWWTKRRFAICIGFQKG